jgi:hypothetical protein
LPSCLGYSQVDFNKYHAQLPVTSESQMTNYQ